MKSLFNRRSTQGRAREVKTWVAQKLDLTDDDLITVAELACHEPDCPPVETVVTVHGCNGQRRTWHIHRPLAEVDENSITSMMSGETR